MKKQILIYITVVVLSVGIIFGGFLAYQSITVKPKVEEVTLKNCTTSDNGKKITYNGKEGVSALNLLSENCNVETNGKGESAYVTSINGVIANSSNEFWSFKVNGEMAQVGAGSYMTKDTEVIDWELSSF